MTSISIHALREEGDRELMWTKEKAKAEFVEAGTVARYRQR